MFKRFFLLICLIGVGFATQAQEMTADDILANYFENTGGTARWKALQSMRMTAMISQMGMEFGGVITTVRPDKQKIEVDVMGQKMIQAYDGKDAWWLFPMQTGPNPQSMPADIAKDFTKQKFEEDLLDYAEKGHQVDLLGEKEVEGAQAYLIQLTRDDGTVIDYYFDKEYFLPIMQMAVMESGPAKGQESFTYLSDYQEVDGLMIPRYLETKVNGQTTTAITIKEIELNPEVADDFFTRPEIKE